MKRIINIRTFFLTALSCVGAVFVGYYISDFPIICAVSLNLGLALFVSLAVVFRKDKTKAISFILCAAFFVSTFSVSLVIKTTRVDEIGGAQTYITGRVCSVIDNGETQSVIVEKVKSDGKSVSGKIKIKFPSAVNNLKVRIDVGDEIEGYFKARFAQLTFDGYGGYAVRRGITYYATVEFDDLTFKTGAKTWRETMLGGLRSALVNNMGEYGDLAYSILTGDKDFLSSEIRGEYSKSGVAHIFAVSGLHVGFLTAFVLFLLGLFKARKLTKALVAAGVLILYNFLLGYSPSIVRATVMSCVLLFAPVFGRRNDMLNNLGLAVTILLAVSPYSLLDVGFQLSVCSVLGITFFYSPIKKFIKFLPEKVSSAIAVSAAAVIGIFPISVIVFNAVHTYSVIVNLIEIPILTIVYIYLLVAGTISALLPFMGFALMPAKWLLQFLGVLNGFVSSLQGSEIVVFGSSAVYLMIVAYFVASRFVMLPKKFIFSIASVVLCAVLIVIENIPFTAFDKTMFYAYSTTDVTTLVSDGTKTYAIGDFYDASAFSSLLRSARVRKIDYVYTFALDEDNANNIAAISSKYGVKRVYAVFDDSVATALFTLNGAGISVYDAEDGDLIIERSDGAVIGYGLKSSASVLFLSSSASLSQLSGVQLFDYSVIRSLYSARVNGKKFVGNLPYTEDGELVEGAATNYGFTAYNYVIGTSKTI